MQELAQLHAEIKWVVALQNGLGNPPRAAAHKMAMSDAAFAGYSGVNSMGMMVGDVDNLGSVPDYLDDERRFM